MNIYYVSYSGRFSDNPRAIYEELAKRGIAAHHTWRALPGFHDEFPRGHNLVARGSVEEQAAFAEADLIISNFPTSLLAPLKKPGAIYLQTWHGTPLKRIYFDEPTHALEKQATAIMREGSRSWDYLLTSNSFSTSVLPGAFAFEGTIWETGYPRNDILLSENAGGVGTQVRTDLGVDSGKTVVLYTPTWRDDVVDASTGNHIAQVHLNLERFANELKDDFVLLLRTHYMTHIDESLLRHAAVIDVSSYEDIRRLYLAADVMVTDYSSTMFDFAVTKKPMVFFPYDLDHYRDNVRGFYFDLFEEAPGPVVRDNDGLITALRNIESVQDKYRARYQAFHSRFCHADDGHAAERVVDRLASLLHP